MMAYSNVLKFGIKTGKEWEEKEEEKEVEEEEANERDSHQQND